MSIRMLVAVVVTGMLLAPPSVAAGGILEKTGELYRELASLKASFTQEVYLPRIGRTKTSSGNVFYQRPRKVRWEYTAGQQGILVGDGSAWFWYEPDENQVVITPYRAESGWEDILFDPSRIGTLMDLRETREKESLWEVVLTPKESSSLTKQVLLRIEGTRGIIVGAVTEDVSGNRTLIRLSDIKENPKLAATLFRFDPPAGTRIIEGR